MKRASLLTFLLVVFVCLSASTARSQIPFVQWYFDAQLQESAAYCYEGTFETAYIAAVNFNMFFSSVEYSIEYPQTIEWVVDQSVNEHQLNIGVTFDRVASVWSLPMNGLEPVVIMKVVYLWRNCQLCPTEFHPIVIRGFGPNDRVRFVRFPDNVEFEAIGMTSAACPLGIPVNETSWGQVKALYE